MTGQQKVKYALAADVLPPVTDDGRMCAKFVVTSEREDREGDIVLTKGGDWTEHRRNPVALFNHQADALPIGKWEDPDGRYTIEPRPELGKSYGTCWFTQATPMGQQCYELTKSGILRAASIGFIVRKAESRGQKGPSGRPPLLIQEWQPTEISVVTIGCNPDAIREQLERSLVAGSPLHPHLRKGLESMAAPLKAWANGWKGYDPNEPRDAAGKWTDGSGGSTDSHSEMNHKEIGEAAAMSFDSYAEAVGGKESQSDDGLWEQRPKYPDGGDSTPVASLKTKNGETVHIYKHDEKLFTAEIGSSENEDAQIIGYIRGEGKVKGKGQTALAVDPDWSGNKIGEELYWQLQSRFPFQGTGGLSDGGRAVLKKVHQRMKAVSAAKGKRLMPGQTIQSVFLKSDAFPTLDAAKQWLADEQYVVPDDAAITTTDEGHRIDFYPADRMQKGSSFDVSLGDGKAVGTFGIESDALTLTSVPNVTLGEPVSFPTLGELQEGKDFAVVKSTVPPVAPPAPLNPDHAALAARCKIAMRDVEDWLGEHAASPHLNKSESAAAKLHKGTLSALLAELGELTPAKASAIGGAMVTKSDILTDDHDLGDVDDSDDDDESPIVTIVPELSESEQKRLGDMATKAADLIARLQKAGNR